MPIDLRTEEVISLAEATRHLPRRSNGKRINVATVHRWASSGCKGVQLETTHVGGFRYTSVEALQRFLDARTDSEGRSSESRPRRPGVSSRETEGIVRAVSQALGTEPQS